MARRRSTIPQAGDKLSGPLSFGLDRPLSTSKFYRKPPKGFPASDRKLDLHALIGVSLAELRRNQGRIKKVLDLMPWSEIEEAIRRLPRPVRTILRELAENGRI